MINLVQKLMDEKPDTWAQILETDYKIIIKRDAHLASLKYDQIESPMKETIVQQCRGMVVDTVRRKVVAWSYDKFWNHGDSGATPIDWSKARVQEKLDGSLMILYWDPQELRWAVASSGTPRASGSFGSDERTFRDAFWQTFEDLGYKLPPPGTWPDACFMFELCDAPNRVVVRHDKPRLALHGARKLTGEECGSCFAVTVLAIKCGWELVKEFPISTIEDCLQAAAALNPLHQEGFVVVDASYNRVKIKSPRYVILHHMKGEATLRRAIQLWQTGEAAELLSHFPELSSTITPVHEDLDAIAAQAVRDFAEYMPRASRKEFATAVKDRPWASVLFKMVDEGSTLEDAKRIMRGFRILALEKMVSK